MEVDKLPNDFWTTGPLCIAHGGTASSMSCKACALSLPPRLEIIAVWVPLEMDTRWGKNTRKANDLPRFLSAEEVKDFIQFNSEALVLRYLVWSEYFDRWAIEEFIKGVGRLPKWRYGIPLAPDAPSVHPDLYKAVKKLSS